MRVPQAKGNKGSLKWIQETINYYPEILNKEVASAFGFEEQTGFEWVSPLEGDEYAEYRDQSFLDVLGLQLRKYPLKQFWPDKGPQWDALGKSSEGIMLVEAKANIPEFVSPGSGASGKSIELIRSSLHAVREYLGVNSCHDWACDLYQYANRLAHLYLLRVLNNQPAFLVFVNYVGASEVGGPESAAEWEAARTVAEAVLGINKRHKLSRYVAHIHLDVSGLQNSA